MTQHFVKNDLAVVRLDSDPTCLGDLVHAWVDHKTILRVVQLDYGDNTILVESVNDDLEVPVWLDVDCLTKVESGNAKQSAARTVLDYARRSLLPAEVVERLQEALKETLGSGLPAAPIGWELITEDDMLIRGRGDYAIRVAAADKDGDAWLSVGAPDRGRYVAGKALLEAVEWAIEAGNIRHAKSGDADA